MRKTALLLPFLLAGAALAAPDGWHTSIDDGVDAAKKSGKPVLVVTIWPPDV
jgi:hypothetical protein